MLLQDQHEHGNAKASQLLGLGMRQRLPRLQAAPDAQQAFAGNLSGLAAGSLSAIKHQTGQPGCILAPSSCPLLACVTVLVNRAIEWTSAEQGTLFYTAANHVCGFWLSHIVHTVCACSPRRADVAVEPGVAATQPVHRGGVGAWTQAMAGAA